MPAPHVLQRALTLSDVSGKIYMPDPRTSNGEIVSGDDFRFRMKLKGATLYWGPKADGVVLHKGQSCLFCTRDCPIVLMADVETGLAIAAHAGRQSILGDFQADQGILYDMIKGFPTTAWERVMVAIVLSIAGDHFPHDPDHEDPGMREKNRHMIRWVTKRYGAQCFTDIAKGCLSLPALIRAQCEGLGIRPENIFHDGVDTYSSNLFYSHRRGDRDGGNLIFVAA